MENVHAEASVRTAETFEFDTSFVLFFLAMDLGQRAGLFAYESMVMVPVLILVMFAPYLLKQGEESFAAWAAGRSVIATFGLFAGIVLGKSIGVLLPEAVSFVPFMLLVLSAMAATLFTFSSMLGFRFAR